MTSSENPNPNSRDGQTPAAPSGKTIDLQGVATFASLVELLAQELGTSAGRIQGLLPNGPASFEELVGEIIKNSQGFQRSLILSAAPRQALKLGFRCVWRDSQNQTESGNISGVESHFFLGATVDQILPQGRALARYAEEVFAIMDRMVTLGQSGRLSSMSVSASEIEAFENQNGDLVRNFSPRRSDALEI